MSILEKELEQHQEEEYWELGTYPTEEEYWELREDPDPDGKQVARVVIGADLYKQVKEEMLFPDYLIMHLLRHFKEASNENRATYVEYYAGYQEIKNYIWRAKSLLLEAILSRKKRETEDLIMKYKSFRKVVNQYLYFFNLPIDFWKEWEDKLPTSKEELLWLLSWEQDTLIKNYRNIESVVGLEWLEEVPTNLD